MMIKLRQPVIVEGRYDRIRLSSVIDGVLIETGGFRIFKDKELLASLRHIANTTGVIIMTDSDASGFKIRNFLKNSLGSRAKITHVYIPSVKGTENRKAAPSAEGLLGVEGLDSQTLLQAFERAGVGCSQVEKKSDLSTADLFAAGLTGMANSAARRRRLLEKLSLPQRMSNSTMLTMLNTLLTREEFFELVSSLDDIAVKDIY